MFAALGAPAGIEAQTSAAGTAFTISDPAASSHSFSFDSSVSHAPGHTIVPRITTPEPPHDSLHDSATGAKIEEFGSAYFYANPLYGTNHLGSNGVGLQGGGGGAQSATINFVVARFGAPPKALPRIAGVDLSAAQPEVALLCYAVRADQAAFPDTAAARVIDLALHTAGRAKVTRIDIAAGRSPLNDAARQALLRQVALVLVREGAHPASILSAGRRVLPPGGAERGGPVPGHVFSLRLDTT